jgi:glycosyltransferase involved in cell wall biosynthesis
LESSPLRILHVTPTYWPAHRYGGPIVAVHGLCRALAARGHEVHVYTTNVDGKGVLAVPPGVSSDVDGVRVTYFPSRFRRLYWSPAMKTALRRGVQDHDVVHTHALFLWPGAAAASEARRAGRPYVISPRGMLVRELVARKSRTVKTAWLRTIERRSFNSASAIHFTSQLEWDEARGMTLALPSPFVIPNGIEVEPQPLVLREPRTLVSVGRVSWKKRLDVVIRSLASLPSARFLVAGNDDEGLTPALRALAHDVGVAGRVEFLGPVYGASKQELLARATLFVLPSLSENFGNVVLEALAMETPVVLSEHVGVASEVAAAGAGIVLGGDWAGPIARLLDAPERRAEMGRRGRHLVSTRFAWPAVATQMESAYRRVLTAAG